jgi:hypothetical protein
LAWTGISGDGNPLQELEGVAFHDFAVFKSARFRFIGVGNHVMRPVFVVHESPLHPCRETGAAAPAQSRSFDHFGHFFRLHLGDRFGERLEPAVLAVNSPTC